MMTHEDTLILLIHCNIFATEEISMHLQSVRLLLVMSLAPLLTRLFVRHSPHLQAAGAD